MSWKDRVRGKIIFQSPGGTRFEAKWAGDDVTLQKRVARHAFPDVDHETAQDLGLQSPDFPLTFYFDDPDHDKTAREFADCVAERGAWQVVHPIIGPLALQPVKITFAVRPVENAGITEISGDWFMPADEPAAIADIAAGVQTAVQKTTEAALEEAVQMPLDNAAKLKNAAEQFKKGYQAAKKAIRTVNERVNGITNTINDLANAATLEVAAISGAVIQLLQSPGLFLGNCAARIRQFAVLGKQIITDLPAAATFSVNQIAAAMTGELWLTAIAAGMGTAILEQPPATRAEALSALRQYQSFIREARATLDALAKASAGNMITEQYIPGPASTEALLRLRAAVTRYLISSVYDLSAERRIALDRPRSPLEIVVTEMGANAGNVDELFAKFCSWNNLGDRKILLLDALEEVIIYA
jgi:prophage DNA circulation protein